MLWQRVLTAIPLAILVVWVVLSNNPLWLQVMIQCFIFVAALEWANMSWLTRLWQRILYASALTVLGYFLLHGQDEAIVIVLCLSVAWWCWQTVSLRNRQPQVPPKELTKVPVLTEPVNVMKLLIGLLVLIPPLLALVSASHMIDGIYWIMYAVSLVWVADIGAYFTGRQWGKHKLAPVISPGKTIEGMMGALAFTAVYALIAARYFELDEKLTIFLVVITIVATTLSITGDLYESLMKRERGIKDSGRILPGHGGVLDRIDSLTSALPFFVLGLDWVLLAEGSR